MDFSDFPYAALKAIKTAEIEAEYLVQEAENGALLGTSFSGLFSDFDNDEPAVQAESAEIRAARNKAADHLFNKVVKHLCDCVSPTLRAFDKRLTDARRWVEDKFHPDLDALDDAASFWREQAATKLATTQPISLRPGGLLAAAIMRRRQALKEGHLGDEYIELAVESALSSRPLAQLDQTPTSAPLVKIPQLDSPPSKNAGGRPKGLPVDGVKLRQLRGRYSQVDFADKCGVSLPTYQRGEGGGPWDERTFTKVADNISAFVDKPVLAEDLKRHQKPQKLVSECF